MKEHIGPRPEMVRDEKPLNIATLRLTGSDASLDEVVGKLRLTVSSRVRAGDPRRRGGVHAASGLSASIAGAANPVAMTKQVRAFIQECLKHCPNLFPEAVDAELAVGISVGDSVKFVASVDLSPADIRDLAAIGIAFSVAAYPTSAAVGPDGASGHSSDRYPTQHSNALRRRHSARRPRDNGRRPQPPGQKVSLL